MTEPDTTPAGQTPSAPEVDQPEGGDGTSGRTPRNPDNDMEDGGEDA